ncbi:xanthine phosphoribosyltransferase [Streptomyces longisporoflavus]|uniref:phosphoribosyltransferase n=1 Tax=Streptomyces longisporoflavus TaxID=28044 RepID=UPI00167DBF55|nr:phosphoribosyltransferase family protein [Streptomyces longisporoflavus]GGV62906.1 xanthine phosphoribosyltransferase [Streptomyces longisporoflavus]
MAADLTLGAVLSWSDADRLTGQLAERIAGESKPQTIVGILRGGMIPAIQLAHQLRIRDVRAVEVTHTASDATNAAKTGAPRYRNPASLGDLAGSDVLLVDDIAGSGATLEHTRRMITALAPRRLRTAVVSVNLANWQAAAAPDTVIDYIALHCEGWVIFPWETR